MPTPGGTVVAQDFKGTSAASKRKLWKRYERENGKTRADTRRELKAIDPKKSLEGLSSTMFAYYFLGYPKLKLYNRNTSASELRTAIQQAKSDRMKITGIDTMNRPDLIKLAEHPFMRARLPGLFEYRYFRPRPPRVSPPSSSPDSPPSPPAPAPEPSPSPSPESQDVVVQLSLSPDEPSKPVARGQSPEPVQSVRMPGRFPSASPPAPSPSPSPPQPDAFPDLPGPVSVADDTIKSPAVERPRSAPDVRVPMPVDSPPSPPRTTSPAKKLTHQELFDMLPDDMKEEIHLRDRFNQLMAQRASDRDFAEMKLILSATLAAEARAEGAVGPVELSRGTLEQFPTTVTQSPVSVGSVGGSLNDTIPAELKRRQAAVFSKLNRVDASQREEMMKIGQAAMSPSMDTKTAVEAWVGVMEQLVASKFSSPQSQQEQNTMDDQYPGLSPGEAAQMKRFEVLLEVMPDTFYDTAIAHRYALEDQYNADEDAPDAKDNPRFWQALYAKYHLLDARWGWGVLGPRINRQITTEEELAALEDEEYSSDVEDVDDENFAPVMSPPPAPNINIPERFSPAQASAPIPAPIADAVDVVEDVVGGAADAVDNAVETVAAPVAEVFSPVKDVVDSAAWAINSIPGVQELDQAIDSVTSPVREAVAAVLPAAVAEAFLGPLGVSKPRADYKLSRSEWALAKAKHDAFYAGRPAGAKKDYERTAKHVVRKAANYDPNKNDFAGLDTRRAARLKPTGAKYAKRSGKKKKSGKKKGKSRAIPASRVAAARRKFNAAYKGKPAAKAQDARKTAVHRVRTLKNYKPRKNDFQRVDTVPGAAGTTAKKRGKRVTYTTKSGKTVSYIRRW